MQGWQQDFQLPAIELGAYWIREPIGDAECGIHPRKTTDPAGAGPVLARNRLLLATRETDSGETEADERERGGFWDGSKVARHKDRCPRRFLRHAASFTAPSPPASRNSDAGSGTVRGENCSTKPVMFTAVLEVKENPRFTSIWS